MNQVDSSWFVLPTCRARVHRALRDYSRFRVSGAGHPPSIHAGQRPVLCSCPPRSKRWRHVLQRRYIFSDPSTPGFVVIPPLPLKSSLASAPFGKPIGLSSYATLVSCCSIAFSINCILTLNSPMIKKGTYTRLILADMDNAASTYTFDQCRTTATDESQQGRCPFVASSGPMAIRCFLLSF